MGAGEFSADRDTKATPCGPRAKGRGALAPFPVNFHTVPLAAIAHLSIAELALNDTKHMLDFRAHLAEPMIAGTLAGRQPAAGFGLLVCTEN